MQMRDNYISVFLVIYVYLTCAYILVSDSYSFSYMKEPNTIQWSIKKKISLAKGCALIAYFLRQIKVYTFVSVEHGWTCVSMSRHVGNTNFWSDSVFYESIYHSEECLNPFKLKKLCSRRKQGKSCFLESSHVNKKQLGAWLSSIY